MAINLHVYRCNIDIQLIDSNYGIGTVELAFCVMMMIWVDLTPGPL